MIVYDRGLKAFLDSVSEKGFTPKDRKDRNAVVLDYAKILDDQACPSSPPQEENRASGGGSSVQMVIGEDVIISNLFYLLFPETGDSLNIESRIALLHKFQPLLHNQKHGDLKNPILPENLELLNRMFSRVTELKKRERDKQLAQQERDGVVHEPTDIEKFLREFKTQASQEFPQQVQSLERLFYNVIMVYWPYLEGSVKYNAINAYGHLLLFLITYGPEFDHETILENIGEIEWRCSRISSKINEVGLAKHFSEVMVIDLGEVDSKTSDSLALGMRQRVGNEKMSEDARARSKPLKNASNIVASVAVSLVSMVMTGPVGLLGGLGFLFASYVVEKKHNDSEDQKIKNRREELQAFGCQAIKYAYESAQQIKDGVQKFKEVQKFRDARDDFSRRFSLFREDVAKSLEKQKECTGGGGELSAAQEERLEQLQSELAKAPHRRLKAWFTDKELQRAGLLDVKLENVHSLDQAEQAKRKLYLDDEKSFQRRLAISQALGSSDPMRYLPGLLLIQDGDLLPCRLTAGGGGGSKSLAAAASPQGSEALVSSPPLPPDRWRWWSVQKPCSASNAITGNPSPSIDR
jgi:hypothetical protein